MTRVLMILGSGETSPTMVTPHQKVFARLPSAASAVLIDTPYGFQENADELTERIQQFFRESVGREVSEVSFRAAPVLDSVAHASQMQHLRTADWIFAGPGSPSYALNTWQDSAVPEILHERLRVGAVVVFSSAATLTLGKFTIPVYEIYKVGQTPTWLPGLDVLGQATGLRAAVIPHWNNTEGGTHDTRYCYVGERRLQILEAQLPADVFVLGVDEHTGLVIDLDTGIADVVGRGNVTVRYRGVEWALAAGSTTSVSEIASHGAPTVMPSGRETSDGGKSVFRDLSAAADTALDSGDIASAIAAISELQRTAGDEAALLEVRRLLARVASASSAPVDATSLLSPYVELLLRLRGEAREAKRWAESDEIRDGLLAAGVIVKDSPEGSSWELPK